MTARLENIELCHFRTCRQVVRHKQGPVTGNVRLAHIDERFAEIRLCLLCFIAYRNRYEMNGWRIVEQEKMPEI